MNRDMDLVREVLLKVEELPYDGGFHKISVNGRTPDEITYHVMLLHEAGLIEAQNLKSWSGPCWHPKMLTHEGHKFLDAIREEVVWQTAKPLATGYAGPLTLTGITVVLPKIADVESDIEDALDLESQRFRNHLSGIVEKRDRETREAIDNLNAKGLRRSGFAVQIIVDKSFAASKAIVDAAIEERRRIVADCPVLGTPERLGDLRAKLDKMVEDHLKATQDRIRRFHGGPDLAIDSALRRVKPKITGLKSHVFLELRMIEKETKLSSRKRPVAGPPVSIQAQHIGALNIAHEIGSIQNHIGHLNSNGQSEVGQAFRQLAEEITKSEGLDETSRREALEVLTELSENAVRPTSQRRPGTIKALVEHVQGLVQTSLALGQLWDRVGPTVRSYFGAG